MKTLMIMIASVLFVAQSFASIPKLNEKNFEALIQAAQNTSLTMNERWQSLVKAGKIATIDQVATIKQFSNSSDWFMRNAMLVSLEAAGFEEAMTQAKILIHDKALVVRSAAVTTLSKKRSTEVKQLFAAELMKTYNYSGRQSLWIRSQLMKHIAKLVTAEDRQFMARYLFDSDKKVAALSAQALEKLTAIHFDTKNNVAQWQAYVKTNRWL